MVLGAVIVVAMLLLGRVLFAVVTDEDWSRMSGLPVGFVNNVLAVLTAVAVVAAMRIVGILLIAAMMVLPVASGQVLARSFGSTLRWSIAVSVTLWSSGWPRQDLGTAPGAIVSSRPVCSRLSIAKRGVAPRLPGPRRSNYDAHRDERPHATHRDAIARGDSDTRRSAAPWWTCCGERVSRSHDRRRIGRSAPPQSSAYRNLAVLEQAGVVRRVITEGEFARFELTEELTEHHHHLICSRCGRVEDVTVPSDLEGTLDKTLDRLAKRAGFADVDHRLDLIGTCGDCAGRT